MGTRNQWEWASQFARMKQVETKCDSYSLLLSNLLGVPGATCGTDFSIRGPKMQRGEKQLTDTTKNVLERLIIDDFSDLGWGQSGVDAEEVCGETSDMRSGKGSSREHFGLPINPSGYYIRAGSVDINVGTVTGEGGRCILECGSGDGNRLLNASGRVVACVTIASCGYDDGDTAFVKLKMKSSSVVLSPASIHSAHTATTAASNALETPPPKLIEATEGLPVFFASVATQLMPAMLWLGDMYQPPSVTRGGGLHVGVAARALITQNLHSNNVGGFSNTVGAGNYGSSTVSPVAISVRVLVWAKGLPPQGTSLEGRVFDEDTSICWIR